MQKIFATNNASSFGQKTCFHPASLHWRLVSRIAFYYTNHRHFQCGCSQFSMKNWQVALFFRWTVTVLLASQGNLLATYLLNQWRGLIFWTRTKKCINKEFLLFLANIFGFKMSDGVKIYLMIKWKWYFSTGIKNKNIIIFRN